MPASNDLTVGIMALVAQQEREAIFRRTKEALAAAKARGVRLGNPNGAAALRKAGKRGVAFRAAATANADDFAPTLGPVIGALREPEIPKLRGIAAELNFGGVPARWGRRWHGSNVKMLLRRTFEGSRGGFSVEEQNRTIAIAE